jgi:hypothetical protein
MADRLGGWSEFLITLCTVLALAWGVARAWGARAARRRETAAGA